MRTVRGKLLFIVALCLGPLLLATVVLSVAMEREERDDASARVSTAKLAFASELADDQADLRAAARLFGGDPEAVQAVLRGDRAAAGRKLAPFTAIYPSLRVIALDAAGSVVASSGATAAAGSLAAEPLCAAALRGKAGESLLRLSLPGEDRALLLFARAQPIELDGRPVGAVLAAVRLDEALLENLRRKSDDAFALEQDGAVLAQSAQGPASWRAGRGRPGEAAAGTVALPLDRMEERSEPDGRVFALLRFEPEAFRASQGRHGVGRLRVLAARDISELARDHRRFLLFRLAALLAVAVLAVAAALSLASGMGRSVAALAEVLPGVELRRYQPARVVRTSDELQRLAESYNAMIGRLREGDLWRRALGKYLSRAALEAVKKGELRLGGTEMQATVLFSDIRGFTALAEGMPPVQVLAVLNRYFTEMVGAVLHHRGIVDKFIGDAIMAVWGPPQPAPGDALDAVRAALEMRRRLERLNEQFARQGLPQLRTGIGLHSGKVVAGNMGAEGLDEEAEPSAAAREGGAAAEPGAGGKMEYTVIGDAVNVASRLESLTKELHADVLLSHDLFVQVEGAVRVEPLQEVQVKGRARPVRVYRLLGLREEVAERGCGSGAG